MWTPKGDRPAVAGQPLHHREMALIRRGPERGGPVVARLGDRPAVAGQPLHHREMALIRREEERGAPVVGRLGVTRRRGAAWSYVTNPREMVTSKPESRLPGHRRAAQGLVVGPGSPVVATSTHVDLPDEVEDVGHRQHAEPIAIEPLKHRA